MGDEAELHEQRASFTSRVTGVRVIPPDDDEFVSIPVLDLVGKDLRRTDDLGPAIATLDGGFVRIDYPGLGRFVRTHVRSDAIVRVRRHAH